MKTKAEINPICGQRVKELIKDCGMQQKNFAKKLGYTPEYISVLVTGKKALPANVAHEIIEKMFPHIRFEWLMGWDDHKTEKDKRMSEQVRKNLWISKSSYMVRRARCSS